MIRSPPPAELAVQGRVEADEPEAFAKGLIRLRREFGLPFLGGCCGTDYRHLERLAARLTR